LKKINSFNWLKESFPVESPKSVLTPERVVKHEHDHMQNLLVAGAPTGETGMSSRSDRYAASTVCTRKPLPKREPIGEGASWIDLASAGQLDPTPSTVETRGDKKLGFRREN
jgi:hypothetical protein